MRANFGAAFCFAALFLFSSTGTAQDNDPMSWDRRISRHVRKYCHECHNADTSSGNVNLAQDTDVRMLLNHRETWQKVLSVVESGEMPPEDEEQIPDEQRNELIAFLSKTLNEIECGDVTQMSPEELSQLDPGPPLLRRLNRREYDLSIQDLLNIELTLSSSFPEDTLSYGFDNVAQSLSMSPLLVEQYHAASLLAIEALQADPSDSNPVRESLYCNPNGTSPTLEQVKQAIASFATAAFRRPVDQVTLDRYGNLYERAREKSEHAGAISYVLQAILISPKFLIRIEQNQPDQEAAYPIDSYELINRLSYFLWSRPPDDELKALAANESSISLDTLNEQVARMLADPRSEALVDGFFEHWLDLHQFDAHEVNAESFPEFTAELRGSMRDEVRSLFRELVTQNGKVTDILAPDHTYLDARLASHYGVQGDFGDELQRVELDDRQRGGVLSSAMWLTSISDPGRTNVPRRGNFIAGQILGAPAPPPPPNVPALEKSSEESGPQSLRQRLEQHRADATCANCHAKMDPWGFALENYDAIGRWRTEDNSVEVDATGQFVNQEPFEGPEGLKQLLLSRKEEFMRSFAKNLLVYALGRGVSGIDECTLRSMIQSSLNDEDRFLPMVQALVRSVPFRFRVNPIDR
jgi:mono/diheme cytochrome c family protein